MENPLKTEWHGSEEENEARNKIINLFHKCPIPDKELLSNLSLFVRRQDLSAMLFFLHMYKKIINLHGVIMEFGVRWGRNMALLSSLRGIFEPFNYNRKIIGFDTFSGFKGVHVKDGNADIIQEDAFSVTKEYDTYLEKILDYHEQESPISHIRKYEIVKGNAVIKVQEYLENNPQTIISFAYFDFDIYEPTVQCLRAIKPYLTRGAIVGFDEMNVKQYQGETQAFDEIFGKNNYKAQRTPYSGVQSYIEFQ